MSAPPPLPPHGSWIPRINARSAPVSPLTSLSSPSDGRSTYDAPTPLSAPMSPWPYSNASSVQQSPVSAPPQESWISPINAQTATFYPPMLQPNAFDGRSTHAQNFLLRRMSGPLHMSGPIVSNIRNPDDSMRLIDTQSRGPSGEIMTDYDSGHPANLQQQAYGNRQPTPHNEKPFVCDTCPQSFMRDHDLKRHQRLHLARKGFLCKYCKKIYSRKDSLKVSF